MPQRLLTYLFLSILMVFTVPYATAQENQTVERSLLPFSDVIINSPNYVAIEFLKNLDVIEGYNDGTFRPNDRINRIEALAMIMRASTESLPESEVQQFNLPEDTILTLNFPNETNIELETPNVATPITLEETGFLELILPQGGVMRAGRIFVEQEPQFTDVKGDEWFFPTLKRAYSLGIIEGYPDGSLHPGSQINLAEAVALLLRTNRVTPTDIDRSGVIDLPVDLAKESWYASSLAYALSRYMISPTLENYIFPGDNITRGDLAAIIYKFMRSKAGVQFGKATWYSDGASKIYPRSNQKYVDQNLTAAHKEYAFGTVARVTNLNNGKFVDVVINDRGPFAPGRVIDLSKTAFEALENPFHGVINVSVEIIYLP